ncbi:hypothetical protein GCM10007160_12490 [Litchfieldella qijiaojingensis]|uniref:Outer membrane lipoprotein carrier protein LolA n=1 Tax=Litchfieldella qijiaojingensis TaxID=980347 RepID=A0ABQ2YLB8_9GAMM|nr:outer membrane lipoprotein carrier protein LolA [Halomonas qijiaojingensis]GGX86647.1 hypothetical protein GCM10007160_12490 [Halomonas qijiaojingensis]
MILPRHVIAALFSLSVIAPSALAFDLEALRSQLSEPTTIQGQFEQRSWLADQETRLYSQGRFIYQRDQRVIWQLLTPVDTTVSFYADMTAPRAWNAEEEEDAADIMALANRFAFAQQLVDLIGGNWPALSHYYHIKLKGEPDEWQVQLTPLAPPLETWLGTLTLEGAELLERITLLAANGDELTVEFENQRTLVDVSLQTFFSEWFKQPGDDTEESETEDEEEGDAEEEK